MRGMVGVLMRGKLKVGAWLIMDCGMELACAWLVAATALAVTLGND
jgi:uncharacterized protein (UPF0212 family)